MKGKYAVIIHDARVRYELIIERQVTIIKGNSGTGKTTLISMVTELIRKGKSSGMHCNCTDKLEILYNPKMYSEEIKSNHGKIYFLDEDEIFIQTKEFAEIVQGSDNYYVIVSRYGRFDWLTYSVNSIYELGTERVGDISVTRLVDRFNNSIKRIMPDLVVTEDSNSGFNMMSHIFSDVKVISANGRDNVYNIVNNNLNRYKSIYVIVDGAAFGSCVGRLEDYVIEGTICLYTPESFEWMLLSTKKVNQFIKSSELSETYNYCDSKDYITWERYYYALLKNISSVNLHVKYAKKKLPKLFLGDDVVADIKNMLSDIIW